MSKDQSTETVRNVYAGFTTGNVALLTTLVTDDFELVGMALGLS